MTIIPNDMGLMIMAGPNKIAKVNSCEQKQIPSVNILLFSSKTESISINE